MLFFELPTSNSGKTSGLSPGFALLLTAETTAGATVGAECSADGAALPEDVANAATAALLEEVYEHMHVHCVHMCPSTCVFCDLCVCLRVTMVCV